MVDCTCILTGGHAYNMRILTDAHTYQEPYFICYEQGQTASASLLKLFKVTICSEHVQLLRSDRELVRLCVCLVLYWYVRELVRLCVCLVLYWYVRELVRLCVCLVLYWYVEPAQTCQES